MVKALALIGVMGVSGVTLADDVTGDFESGKSLYSSCMGCHGVQFKGGVGPALGGREASELAELLVKYRSGESVGPMSMLMAPFAVTLSDTDITDLTFYIQESSKPEEPEQSE